MLSDQCSAQSSAQYSVLTTLQLHHVFIELALLNVELRLVVAAGLEACMAGRESQMERPRASSATTNES